MLIRYFKRVDKNNKITLPKVVVDAFGTEFYLEVHENKIVLVPLKKGE